MNILHDPIYLILSALCLASAVLPSMLPTVGKLSAIAIASLWLASCTVILFRFGLIPGLSTLAISGLLGLLLMVLSLIRSGIRSMPNQRFEDR